MINYFMRIKREREGGIVTIKNLQKQNLTADDFIDAFDQYSSPPWLASSFSPFPFLGSSD